MLDKSVKEYIEVGSLPKIAKRLRHHVEKDLQWSRAKYHARCQEAAHLLAERFPLRHAPPDDVPLSRINQLFALAHHHEQQPKARALSRKKLEVLAFAAGLPIEDLLFDDESEFILADPYLDPEIRGRVGRHLQHYETLTGELIALAGFLPCSLETDAFMRAHHEALFAHLEPEEKAVVTETYNNIGAMRSQRLLTKERVATSTMTQVMFESGLVDIAKGHGVYAGMVSSMRVECLQKLHRIVSEHTNKVSLIVGEDSSHSAAKNLLKKYDSVLVFKTEFAIVRLHNLGIWKFSANNEWIGRLRRPVDEFMRNARWREPEHVSDWLGALIDSIKRAE